MKEIKQKIKREIVNKFSGEINDWDEVSSTEKDGYFIREFKNKITNKTITSIIWRKDLKDSRNWFFKEDQYEFSFYSAEYEIQNILDENLEDLENGSYEIYFSVKGDPYNFERSVSEYLSLFQNLSDDYMEVEENSFVYIGSECKTLSDVIDDLESLGFNYFN